jgi:hypothetical protein
MRLFCVFILFIFTASAIADGDGPAANNTGKATTRIGHDSVFDMVQEIPIKVKAEIVRRKENSIQPLIRDFIPALIDYRTYSLYHYYPREGMFYLIFRGGRHFPVFSVERFRIDEEAQQVIVNCAEDPMDELLGYGGSFIFDDFDFRRHMMDSLGLEQGIYSPVIKK